MASSYCADASSTTTTLHSATTLLLQINDGYTSFACNFLRHYYALRIPNMSLLAITHGRASYDSVRALATGADDRVVLAAAGGGGDDANAFSKWNQPSFNSLVFDKLQRLVDELRLRPNRPVLYTDLDTVWRSNPLVHVARAAATAVAAHPSQQRKKSFWVVKEDAFHYCMGFFVACPSAATIALLREWREAVAKTRRAGALANDQEIFQQLMLQNESGGLRSLL